MYKARAGKAGSHVATTITKPNSPRTRIIPHPGPVYKGRLHPYAPKGNYALG
jgi:hypothetical protein